MLLLLLFLCVLLFMSLAGDNPGADDRWSLSSVSPTAYTFAGDGGMVYLFDGNDVYAIRDGSLQWKYTVPAEWSVINEWSFNPRFYGPDSYGSLSSLAGTLYVGPIFASGSDTLYLYAAPDINRDGLWSEDEIWKAWGYDWNASGSGEKLMAIRDGRLMWERPMPRGAHEFYIPGDATYDDVSLYALGNRLYVYHQYNVTVLDKNGTQLFAVNNVSAPPAFDEEGYMYTVTTAIPDFPDDSFLLSYPMYMEPSGTIEARYPNGTLYWRTDIGMPAIRQNVDPGFGLEHRTLPLYGNGMLYVPSANGVVTLSRDGSVLWTCEMDGSMNLYEKMPFDSKGNVYLVDEKAGYLIRYPLIPTLRDVVEQSIIEDRKIYVVGKDGGPVTAVDESYDGRAPLAAADGVAYYVTSVNYDADRPSMDSLLSLDVTARVLCSDEILWTVPLPQGTVRSVTLNQSNLGWVFYDSNARKKTVAYNDWHPSAWRDPELTYRICGDARWINMLPYGGNIYVNYYSLNYEYPSNYENWTDPLFLRTGENGIHYIDVKGSPYMAVFNRSRCDYTAGVLALAGDGRVLWQRSTGAYVTGMAANNSTIYYGTGNGGLSATSAGVATGLAILASAFLFFRFFLFGAVSRARDRLEHNENRNLVLEQIRESPGGTMYDTARALGMNIGTLRYHLLILGVNHKVATHRDGKFVRFFSPSSAYSQDEREIISLLRREPVRRLVSVLRERPGISNAELAAALGLSEPAISNYMKELSVKGIVAKEAAADGRISYAIQDEHADRIAATLQRSEKA